MDASRRFKNNSLPEERTMLAGEKGTTLSVLLSYKGSVNLGDADGCPVLNVAILYKWVEGARAALAAGAAAAAVSTGLTTNVWADRRRRMADMVITMMLHRVEVRYPSVASSFLTLFFKQTPVHLAVEMDELGLLEEILDERKELVDCPNAYGETALYTAVANNNFPAAKTLLQRGASVNGTHKLLHAAVRHPCILKYILDKTDAVDSLDHKGYAPLHKAVMINFPESVNLLLKRFENPKLKTKNNGMTALHLAALHASNQAAQAILEHDSTTVKRLDDDCNTPLAIAVNKGNKALILMLLKKGALLSTKRNKKKTVIELIASKFLDCSSFFELVFDEFIYTDEFNNIIVDYGCISHIGGTQELKEEKMKSTIMVLVAVSKYKKIVIWNQKHLSHKRIGLICKT